MAEPVPDRRFVGASGEGEVRTRFAERMRPTSGDGFVEFAATGWERRYRWLVVGSDVLSTLLGVLVAAGLLRVLDSGSAQFPRALATAAAVLAAVAGCRAWSERGLGQGAEEFRRLGKGFVTAGVVLAGAGLLFGSLGLRVWVFGVVPALAAVALLGRYTLRKWLHRQRRQGRCLLPLLAVGNPDAVGDLIARARSEMHVGWRVEAVCTPGARGSEVAGVPVVGGLDEVAEQVHRGGYRTVAVTADQHWSPEWLQELAWDLEDTCAEMVVAPMLMDVAGPRLQVSGVLGMPLLRVSEPSFTGARRVVKEAVDRVGAALLLVLMVPVLALIALSIKLDDRGPVAFRQRRVGRHGRIFTMWKFRTMVAGAEGARAGLREVDEGAGPLFKLRADPRVTRVGRVLRRYSLDELPQLVNVVAGAMSLVGPRPPLPEETRTYQRRARRRLLVKPGLTGLWQVSGRSDLSWSESVRLDLRYVEDWSLALDAMIVWKTVRAVLGGAGAY